MGSGVDPACWASADNSSPPGPKMTIANITFRTVVSSMARHVTSKLLTTHSPFPHPRTPDRVTTISHSTRSILALYSSIALVLPFALGILCPRSECR